MHARHQLSCRRFPATSLSPLEQSPFPSHSLSPSACPIFSYPLSLSMFASSLTRSEDTAGTHPSPVMQNLLHTHKLFSAFDNALNPVCVTLMQSDLFFTHTRWHLVYPCTRQSCLTTAEVHDILQHCNAGESPSNRASLPVFDRLLHRSERPVVGQVFDLYQAKVIICVPAAEAIARRFAEVSYIEQKWKGRHPLSVVLPSPADRSHRSALVGTAVHGDQCSVCTEPQVVGRAWKRPSEAHCQRTRGME